MLLSYVVQPKIKCCTLICVNQIGHYGQMIQSNHETLMWYPLYICIPGPLWAVRMSRPEGPELSRGISCEKEWNFIFNLIKSDLASMWTFWFRKIFDIDIFHITYCIHQIIRMIIPPKLVLRMFSSFLNHVIFNAILEASPNIHQVSADPDSDESGRPKSGIWAGLVLKFKTRRLYHMFYHIEAIFDRSGDCSGNGIRLTRVV